MFQPWRVHDDSFAPQHGHVPGGVPGKLTLTSGLRLKSADAPADAPAAANAASSSPRDPAASSSFADPFDYSDRALAAPAGSSASLELAHAGFSGAPVDFPHRAAIERSFGTALPARAYTDAAAARASHALGAHGYALGDQVAFASASPDLAVAAHEAAHVMQATSGVHCYGGTGDYEAHADLVAERVVRGESAADLLASGPVASTAVRKQTYTAASASATNQQQPGGSGAAANSPVQRVQAAIATGSVPAVVALQRELRNQQNPAQPDANVREALKTARQWEMERIAAIRASYAQRIATANTASSTEAPVREAVASGEHATNRPNAGEDLETAMDLECTPYLDALLQGDPQERYLHSDNNITAQVFAAVRLHSSRRGLQQIGHRGAAEDEARQHGGVHTGSWCGAFAYTQAEQAGGFDSRWSENMAGTGGIMSALRYHGGSAQTWIWVDGAWQALHDYHVARGSERVFHAVTTSPPPQGIQAGDIILWDNRGGDQPDHINTVVSFDGRYVTAIGGNQGGSDRNDQTGVSRSGRPYDLTTNPTPNENRLRDANGRFIDGSDDPHGHKHTRIYGFGRWSIVDYERHVYAMGRTRPTAPPSQRDLNERR